MSKAKKMGPSVEQVEVIRAVAARLAPKFIFGYYTVEDITQEGFILGLEGFESWDGERSLENFLYAHIKNRLINFKRKHYYRKEKPKDERLVEKWERRNTLRKNLMSPIDIDVVDENSLCDNTDILQEMVQDELMAKIEGAMPAEMRSDFLRLLAGVRLSEERRAAVQKFVEGVLYEEAEEDGDD